MVQCIARPSCDANVMLIVTRDGNNKNMTTKFYFGIGSRMVKNIKKPPGTIEFE
jgi:hypothetical protein